VVEVLSNGAGDIHAVAAKTPISHLNKLMRFGEHIPSDFAVGERYNSLVESFGHFTH